MAGHQYLEMIRDPEIWRQTKESAQKIGSFSLDVLSALAKGFPLPADAVWPGKPGKRVHLCP